ncbi:putative nucleotide-diphospho-sugar transferase [Niallia sp. 03190]|uniref:putative nucleotide-diphospho-sugar transferase n=1 Tax=Niallia sp. 03190 TaxID=3458061 RepID=UPI0040445BBE
MNMSLEAENIFCTILTKGRVYQGLALLESLTKVIPNTFYLYVLCADEESFSLLKKINNKHLYLIQEKELEQEIVALKKQRKIHEYCWTLKPVLIEHLMMRYPLTKRVTYLDSDLYFWQNPTIIFAKQPDCSVLLSIEEKYKPSWKKSKKWKLIQITGLYNSGFISFKQDANALLAVKWWKEQCVSSCKISPEEGTFGDQKYLDDLPRLFSNVCMITTPGVNIGPWNYLKYHFSLVDSSIFIDEDKLIFYHFSSLRVEGKNKFTILYPVKTKKLPFIYMMYKHALNNAIKLAQKADPNFNIFATTEDLQRYWK